MQTREARPLWSWAVRGLRTGASERELRHGYVRTGGGAHDENPLPLYFGCPARERAGRNKEANKAEILSGTQMREILNYEQQVVSHNLLLIVQYLRSHNL